MSKRSGIPVVGRTSIPVPRKSGSMSSSSASSNLPRFGARGSNNSMIGKKVPVAKVCWNFLLVRLCWSFAGQCNWISSVFPSLAWNNESTPSTSTNTFVRIKGHFVYVQTKGWFRILYYRVLRRTAQLVFRLCLFENFKNKCNDFNKSW